MLTKNSIFTTIILLLCAISIVSAQGKKGKEPAKPIKDEDAIRAVIEKETKAFFEINQEEWQNCWAHVPYAFWSFADTTDVNSFSGWDNISSGFNNYFKTSKPSTAKIKRDWNNIKVYNNGAYVLFTQQVKDETERPLQSEIRVLEKINNEWKIVCVSVIAVQKDNVPIR